MPVWKYIPYHIDIDPEKPGRTQHWFDLQKIEEQLGRKITWVYSNFIEPGAVAGRHYHLEHEVAIWCVYGELEMHLEDKDSGEKAIVPLKTGPQLLTIPKKVYHAAHNVSKTQQCLAVMFASSEPRNRKDEYFS